MWAPTISFHSSANPTAIRFLRSSPTNRSEFKSLKLRASFFDYPLASRVIVRNLPYSTSERSLLENFSNFGQIAEVKLIIDKTRRRSKGFAFIQFTSQDDAMLAIENMDHQNLDGRMIYVEVAKPGKDAFGGYPRTSGPPIQQQQQHLQEQEEVADCWYWWWTTLGNLNGFNERLWKLSRAGNMTNPMALLVPWQVFQPVVLTPSLMQDMCRASKTKMKDIVFDRRKEITHCFKVKKTKVSGFFFFFFWLEYKMLALLKLP